MGVFCSEKRLLCLSDKLVLPVVKQPSSRASPFEAHTMFPSDHFPPGFGGALVTTLTFVLSRCLLPTLVEAQAKCKVTLLTEAEQPKTFSVKGTALHYQLHWAQMLQNTLNSHERS